MMSTAHPTNALLFGLSDDLARELTVPLRSMCCVESTHAHDDVADSDAQIIFCGPDTRTVRQLRAARPGAPIVVVSRHAEVSCWLDSMEAGATDYCAAPFESGQVKWIVDSSLRVSKEN